MLLKSFWQEEKMANGLPRIDDVSRLCRLVNCPELRALDRQVGQTVEHLASHPSDLVVLADITRTLDANAQKATSGLTTTTG